MTAADSAGITITTALKVDTLDASGSSGKLVRITSATPASLARIYPPSATTLTYTYVKDMQSVGYAFTMDATSVNGGNTVNFIWPSSGRSRAKLMYIIY